LFEGDKPPKAPRGDGTVPSSLARDEEPFLLSPPVVRNLPQTPLGASLQSCRHGGGFWGLSSPKQSSKPPKNTINQLSFCQFLECQAPPHKLKAPRRNAKPPLLKTFWRRFCITTCIKISGGSFGNYCCTKT